MAESVTMADFRKACEDRLNHAIEGGEGVITRQIKTASGDIEMAQFETPAGLTLLRYGGSFMRVECDFSEPGSDTLEKTEIEFYEGKHLPRVVEVLDGPKGRTDRTVKLARHDEVAQQLSKFLTLIP